MEDKKENLNSALDNDALESVAGGAAEDWSPERKKKLWDYMEKCGYDEYDLEEKFKSNIKNYSPETFKVYLQRKGLLDDELTGILS